MTLDLKPRKRIGLVAHDNKKSDLIEWARYNRAHARGARSGRDRHDRHAARARSWICR